VRSRSAEQIVEEPNTSAEPPVDSKQISYLTVAMINRLWTPSNSTIVGLLGVDASQNNYQELSMSIEKQMASSANGGVANQLTRLERRFRDAISHYAEM